MTEIDPIIPLAKDRTSGIALTKVKLFERAGKWQTSAKVQDILITI